MMTPHSIAAAEATTAAMAPAIIGTPISIAAVAAPANYEITISVTANTAGNLRAAIVATTTAAPALSPICMINVTGAIAPGSEYDEHWTAADAPAGIPWGQVGATLSLYVYESDGTATLNASILF